MTEKPPPEGPRHALLLKTLEGMVASLQEEAVMSRARADTAVRTIQAEIPEWTEAESTGHVAKLRQQADSASVLAYRLQRMTRQVAEAKV